MTDPIRALELTKRYGDRTVVDRVTFSVAAGQLLAVLGPNGAGKTTTVEILEGYRRADDGRAEVLGRDPGGADSEHRARVGIMLQSGGIDPRATAREVLALHASFYRQPREVDELLGLVELGPLGGARYRTLSGGERQRLALAIAIVGRPDVLLLDEPTAGMDPAARARTRDLVAGLRDEGAAILLTTHDLPDVERLADRLLIIAGGRVVAAGTPAEITTGARPRVSFRLASPMSGTDRAELSSRLRAPVDAAGTGSYAVDAPASPRIVAELTAWLADRGLLVTELRAGVGTLEQRYLELTGEDDRP